MESRDEEKTMSSDGRNAATIGSPVDANAGAYSNPMCGDGEALPTGEAAINQFTPGTVRGEIVVFDRGLYGRPAGASPAAPTAAQLRVVLEGGLTGTTTLDNVGLDDH